MVPSGKTEDQNKTTTTKKVASVTTSLESLTALLEYFDLFSNMLTPISYATGNIYGCPSTHASYVPVRYTLTSSAAS